FESEAGSASPDSATGVIKAAALVGQPPLLHGHPPAASAVSVQPEKMCAAWQNVIVPANACCMTNCTSATVWPNVGIAAALSSAAVPWNSVWLKQPPDELTAASKVMF